MTVRNLDALFGPQSIAVVGASNQPHTVGAVVVRNLLGGGFDGPVMPVSSEHEAVAGVLAVAAGSDVRLEGKNAHGGALVVDERPVHVEVFTEAPA